MHAVACELHSICRQQDLHGCVAGEQIDHQTFRRRVEMLDQDEGSGGLFAHGAEEAPEGVQPTRGGT